MSFVKAQVGRVYLIRWTGPATVSDFKEQLRDMTEAHEHLRSQLYYVPITPEGTPALSSEVRGEATKMMPRVFEYCASIDNVLEGDGFWASIMRSMFAGMVLATRVRYTIHVHATLEEALTRLRKSGDIDATAVLRKAESMGYRLRGAA